MYRPQGPARTEKCVDSLLLVYRERHYRQSSRKLLHERGLFFSFSKVSVSSSLFSRCCCAVLCFLSRAYKYRHTPYQNKKISTLPGVYTYVRYVSERSGRNRQRREAYVAPELFSLEPWRRGTLGIIESPVCSYNHHERKNIFKGPQSCPLFII